MGKESGGGSNPSGGGALTMWKFLPRAFVTVRQAAGHVRRNMIFAWIKISLPRGLNSERTSLDHDSNSSGELCAQLFSSRPTCRSGPETKGFPGNDVVAYQMLLGREV